MPRILSPSGNQPEHDLVMTPDWLASDIVGHFPIRGLVLDPARGQGAFYNQLTSSSLIANLFYCELSEDRDFLRWQQPVHWIITNPPWSKMRDFLIHGMEVAEEVVYLATLTHFVTRARLRDISDAGFGLREAYLVQQPPEPWPANGFQLAAVWVSKGWKGGLEFTRSAAVAPELKVEHSAEELGL